VTVLRQVSATTQAALFGLHGRLLLSAITVIGISTSVAVMASILAISGGLSEIVHRSQQPDQVMVLSALAPSEYMGSFSPAQIAMIADSPEIRRSEGQAAVQPLAAVAVELYGKKDEVQHNVLLRGTGPMGRRMDSSTFRIVEGRDIRAGVRELIAGKAAAAQFKNLNPGDTLVLRGAPWRVVGIFEDGGGVDENTLVTDVTALMSAFGQATYQSAAVQLSSHSAFQSFARALNNNPQLSVRVLRRSDYYQEQIKPLQRLAEFVGYAVGAVMAVGATCGAVVTLYTSVDARKREIATLRAIGFGGASIVASIFVEALALSVLGGLLGIGASWLLFNNQQVASGGFQFPMAITLGIGTAAWVLVVVVGLLGAVAPAAYSLRFPIAAALRAS
jgi:putative ABC transport system permease protein